MIGLEGSFAGQADRMPSLRDVRFAAERLRQAQLSDVPQSSDEAPITRPSKGMLGGNPKVAQLRAQDLARTTAEEVAGGQKVQFNPKEEVRQFETTKEADWDKCSTRAEAGIFEDVEKEDAVARQVNADREVATVIQRALIEEAQRETPEWHGADDAEIS